MHCYTEFRLFDEQRLPAEVRRGTPTLLVKNGRDLVFTGFQEPATLSEGLKRLWDFLQLERAWIKRAIAAGAKAEVRCYLRTLEEEIRIDPEGLLACTKLGVALVIEKKKLKGGKKEPNQSLEPTSGLRPDAAHL
jgi:hypothetical protein